MKSLDQLHNPIETLEAINRYQRMTTAQIARLLFEGLPAPEGGRPRSRDHALRDCYRSCVTPMEHMGLIVSEQMGHFVVKKLTRSGARLLKESWEEQGIPGQIRKQGEERSPLMIPHYMAAHDALVAFEAAGFHYGLEVADFKDETWIKSEWKGLQPDGYIYLTDGVSELCALIEVERSSKVGGVAFASFEKKVPRYIELMHTSHFPAPPVVFSFARTLAKAESLRRATQDEKVGGRSNFWFGTIEMLTDPISFFSQPFLVATAKPRTIAGKLSMWRRPVSEFLSSFVVKQAKTPTIYRF